MSLCNDKPNRNHMIGKLTANYNRLFQRWLNFGYVQNAIEMYHENNRVLELDCSQQSYSCFHMLRAHRARLNDEQLRDCLVILRAHRGITSEMGLSNSTQPSFALQCYNERPQLYCSLSTLVPELFEGAYLPDENGCTILSHLWDNSSTSSLSSEIIAKAPVSALQPHYTIDGATHDPIRSIYLSCNKHAFLALLERAVDLSLSSERIQEWSAKFANKCVSCDKMCKTYIWHEACANVATMRKQMHSELCTLYAIPPVCWIMVDYVVLDFLLGKDMVEANKNQEANGR
jgi:hypothetical protein